MHPTNPFWTDALYYPFGAPLYYHTLGLPLGAIGLLPQVISGLPAAYNTVLLAGFTLSGYGAFRLALLFTANPFAAFAGGVVYAFTPYTLDALKGQTEVLSVQWLPLYAEAWLRAMREGHVRHMVLAGVFLAVAALSSLYYALYALLFTLAHVIYTLFSSRTKRQLSQLFLGSAVTFGVTLVLTLPLVWGLLSYRSDPRLDVAPDLSQKLAYSADLVSFFIPPADHPLLGNPPQPGATPPPFHSYLSLGYVALGLSVLGLVVYRKRKGVLFWGVLGTAALILALGPELQVAGNKTGVPMPYKLFDLLPGWDSVAKVERLVVLARLCMGVLGALGAGWVLAWLGQKLPRRAAREKYGSLMGRILPSAAVLALLLVELPIHPRYIEPLNIPEGYRALGAQIGSGALMELPFATRQAETLGRRMLYQTAHGKPIMGGYLARSYGSPIADTCSPFWGFISARYPAEDIISPRLVSHPLDVLNFYKIGYLSLYETYGGPSDETLDPEERAAFMGIISGVQDGPPIYKDGYVSIYKVRSLSQPPEARAPLLLMGNNWHQPETSGDEPFRWVSEDTARLCVFSATDREARLILEGTAFGGEREVMIKVGGRETYSATLTANGAFTRIETPLLEWPAGMTEITLFSPNPPTTPQSLSAASGDTRPLRVGFRRVRLEP